MKWIKGIYHYLLSFLGALIYRSPSKGLFVIGVTGTKGKTTSVHLIHHILNENGKKTALLSSVSTALGENKKPNLTGNTMPGRFFIQRFLKQAKDQGCKYAAIEVTSQGVDQHRHRFIKFGVAAFTNLHKEHIEAHGSFEKYRKAKVSFFKYVAKQHGKGLFFINRDDSNKEYFERAALGHDIKLYSGSDEDQELKILPGEINKPNIALARAICKKIGLTDEEINKGLESFEGVEGRMEVVQEKPFSVVIDYAYTPESVKLAYKQLTKLLKGDNNKIISVFGSAGGGRDKWKRPVLGEIAAKYCGVIILTSEEPYDERPEDIIKDIETGIDRESPVTVYKITDRKVAIEKAVEEVEEGDVIALMGKGAEPYIHLGNKKILWNEKKIAQEILEKK